MPAPTSLVTLRGPHFPAEIGKKRKGGRLASPKGLISQKFGGRGLQFLEPCGDDSPYTSEDVVRSERGSCLQSCTQRSPRPGAALSAVHVLTHVFLTSILHERYHSSHPHFTGGETEAPGD